VGLDARRGLVPLGRELQLSSARGLGRDDRERCPESVTQAEKKARPRGDLLREAAVRVDQRRPRLEGLLLAPLAEMGAVGRSANRLDRSLSV
jgi:hypothetical protein